jgi:ACS family allantoate permease-like MFS transporter
VLGVFESSISPALMLFTAQWYRKREQGTRTGIWASFNTWGGILGAGVAYALYKAELKHELSMKAWRCLFLFFGCTTIFLGIVFAIVVPDTPAKAWFLTAEEKVIAVRRTSENMENIGVKKWEWYQVKDAYTDPQVILMCFVALITSIPNGGITK